MTEKPINQPELKTVRVNIDGSSDKLSSLSLETIREKNKNQLAVAKNRLSSALAISIFFVLSCILWSYRQENIDAINLVENDQSLEFSEKIEKVNALNKDFLNESKNLLLPTFTLIVGYLIGSSNQEN